MTESDARVIHEPDPPLDNLDPPTSEITYDEQFYPARPRRLRPSARRVLRDIIRSGLSGSTDADNEAYVKWLVDQSMLRDAGQLATQLSGQGSMWQNPFAHPDPRAAVERGAGLVHRLPALVHQPARGQRSSPGWPTRSCGRRFAGSGSTPSTPVRSSWPAASRAGT